MSGHHVGFQGKQRLSHSPGEVRQVVERMYADGQILAVILENEEGIGVQVFGEPSQTIYMPYVDRVTIMGPLPGTDGPVALVP